MEKLVITGRAEVAISDSQAFSCFAGALNGRCFGYPDYPYRKRAVKANKKENSPLSFEAFRQSHGSDDASYAKIAYYMELDRKRIVTDSTLFWGLALEKLLHPRKLVILGTAGSS